MEFVIAAIVVFLVMRFLSEAAERDRESVFKTVVKQCPPHKWSWKPKPDGVGEYISCEACKMIPGRDIFTSNKDDKPY